MKAVILLGGKGTRFRPLTFNTPKALLKVQGKTVPEHLIDLFKKYNITDLIFSVGYLASKVREYFKDGSQFGVNITYVEEKTPLGSAGAIKLASNLLKEAFIVTNGDELKSINLDEMYTFHKSKSAKITVALTQSFDPSSYGVANIQDNIIEEFVEKPKIAPSNFINSGLSIWEPDVIKLIPDGFCMYEKEIYPILAKQKKLFGYMMSGQWFDTGTPERYELAVEEWRGIE